jgi:hypothetical protein
MDDKMRKGRGNHARGEDAGSAKLTEQQVRWIRQEASCGRLSMGETAARLGVGYNAVRRAAVGQTWKHL